MTMKEILSPRMAIAAVAAITGFAGSAAAQQSPGNGARSFGGAPSAPTSTFGGHASDVGMMRSGAARHYQDSASRRTFVVERHGDTFLLKFDNDPEVLALHPTIGQGGDTFLRSDDGRLMLRVTEVGSMIAYFANQNGVPADMYASAAASNLSLSSPPAMTASLTALQKDAAQRLTKFAGHEVTVFGASEFGDNEGWAADALKVIIKGVESADNGSGKLVRSVSLHRSSIASVAFNKDGELAIGVNPRDGYMGRQSSTAIAAAIAKGGN
jgi:hypothetical protein